jgi:integrase
MVLLACFGGLRWGELVALRRRDIDTATAAVRITRQLTKARGQAPFFAPPKSAAGRRRVILPGSILAEVQQHLDNYTGAAPDALLFTSPRGELLRHSNFWRITWVPAMTATGLTGIHFHDLRHAGNHLVAEAGASLRELMDRMGHCSSRAALNLSALHRPAAHPRRGRRATSTPGAVRRKPWHERGTRRTY